MERQVTGMSCKLLEGFHPTALSQPKHGESQRPGRCTSLASWLAAFTSKRLASGKKSGTRQGN